MADLLCVGGQNDGRWVSEHEGYVTNRGKHIFLSWSEPLMVRFPITRETPMPVADRGREVYALEQMTIPLAVKAHDGSTAAYDCETVSFWRHEDLTIKQALEQLFRCYRRAGT
jgi:hypothetical protein